IPAQHRVITPAELISSYGTTPTNTDILAQQANNIYVRAKNLSSCSATGQIYLYYARSSLLLRPSEWSCNPIKTAAEQTSVTVVDASGKTPLATGAVGVGSSAFAFPAPPVPQGFHYCMIARVVTVDHPNPIPTTDFPSSAAFIRWVYNNPAVCWRNVNVVP